MGSIFTRVSPFLQTGFLLGPVVHKVLNYYRTKVYMKLLSKNKLRHDDTLKKKRLHNLNKSKHLLQKSLIHCHEIWPNLNFCVSIKIFSINKSDIIRITTITYIR